jgi:hypothetical protein
MMFGSVRRAAGVLTVAIALGFGAPASASAAVTVSLPATAQLTAGVLVTVPVTVTCGPYESLSGSNLSVSIRQASKKAIARGSAFLGGFGAQPLTCDGAPHVYPVDVLADPGGPPFRKGDAVITAFASAQTDCCTSDSGSAGPQVVRLR